MKVELLNIPNFYSTYYLFGLGLQGNLTYKENDLFKKYNGYPKIIFSYKTKIYVIDNDDPSGIDSYLYEKCSKYFVTNRLKNDRRYDKEKVESLFPHYPINCAGLYIKCFGLDIFRKLGLKEGLRQLRAISKRPKYRNYKLIDSKENFVFFISRIWKKEKETNELRTIFINTCLSDRRLKFEGGLVPRSDGNNLGFERLIVNKKYSPKKFNRLSAKSKFVLNNPAVLGAVSWRFAEYLNLGLFVISTPFKVVFPIELEHNYNICMVKSTSEFKTVINKNLNDRDYRMRIKSNAKEYFDKYCSPNAQINYIKERCVNDF